MTEKEIQILALKFLKGQASKEEEALLHAWYENKGTPGEKVVIHTADELAEDVRDRLYKDINSRLRGKKISNGRKMLRYAAAILLAGSLAILFFHLNKPSVQTTHYTKLLKNDVGPGGNKAILQLGNGVKIDLDKASIGGITEANGLIVSKDEEGFLSLTVSNTSAKDAVKMNALQIPKGGQYKIQLPDGTIVWLNASSTLLFPSEFKKDSREVQIEGEAYFEVAHILADTKQSVPFVVNSKNQRIEVLGTHFNVNTYPNEPTIKTTLLEGSVRIVLPKTNKNLLLKPGQRSVVQNGLIDLQLADLESDVAWKNGDFIFVNENLNSIMRKLERWYDVEVNYSEEINNLRFSGAVSRSKNISEVLKIIELTGKVKFKIDGRRIFVMT